MSRPLMSIDGSAIVGTAEIIFGVARIEGADAPGEGRACFELAYSGGTDVDWDSQTTRREKGERLFVDCDGRTWRESEIVFAPEDDEEDEDEPDPSSDDYCPNSDNHRHEWPRHVEEHERALCCACGADGDA